MRVDTINPLALTGADIAAWRGFLAADPALTSPYLTPDWARLVAGHRPDVRTVVWRNDDGAAAGFLAVQGSDPHAAMPVGGPVCDYQAVAGASGLDVSLAARALGVGRIDLTAGLKENAVGECLLTEDVGHVVRFADGWDGWCAERQAAGSKIAARARKRMSKLVRDNDQGAVTFEPFLPNLTISTEGTRSISASAAHNSVIVARVRFTPFSISAAAAALTRVSA